MSDAAEPTSTATPSVGPRDDAWLDLARLDCVTHKFGLSPVETAILQLLARAEIDAGFVETTRRSTGCFTFADLAPLLPTGGDPRLILPGSPLRRWHLVELYASRFEPLPLVHQTLRIGERLLAHLLGHDAPDERLEPLLEFAPPLGVLTPAQRACAAAIAAVWSDVPHFDAFRPVAIAGQDPAALRAIAWESARAAGLSVAELRIRALPEPATERRELLRRWQVEALLGASALYLDATELDTGESGLLREWLRQPGGAVIIGHRDELSLPQTALRFVAPPTSAEDRAKLIGAVLNGHAPKDPDFAARLAGQFELGAAALYEACRDTEAIARMDPEACSADALWRSCRERARPRLGPLVQVIESRVGWADLILPEEQLATLREAVAQVRSRTKVHDQWGFAAKSTRGLNLTALFSGPSGAGKTLAAEVIANDLGLDLLRVDLSAVVSKYIGDTEKHLATIFDAAETGAAVLLFDEADALFGPRSKVNDSRDRHANIEVSYLLQRLEAFRGLAILTTNFRENLDPAFSRRIRFHVEFPFPDRATRARLWRAAFPAATPLDTIDFDRLSRLSLTGGHIRNVALNAAFQAAGENCAVHTRHLVAAARGEFRKSEKPIPEGELRALLDLAS